MWWKISNNPWAVELSLVLKLWNELENLKQFWVSHHERWRPMAIFMRWSQQRIMRESDEDARRASELMNDLFVESSRVLFHNYQRRSKVKRIENNFSKFAGEKNSSWESKINFFDRTFIYTQSDTRNSWNNLFNFDLWRARWEHCKFSSSSSSSPSSHFLPYFLTDLWEIYLS